MQPRFSLIILVTAALEGFGCAASGVEPTRRCRPERTWPPAAQPARAACGRVVIQTTVHRFDDSGQTTNVSKRSRIVCGLKAAAPVEELLDSSPAECVSRQRHETVHHRRIIDRTGATDEGLASQDQARPQDGQRDATSQPAAQASWIRWLFRALLGLFGMAG